MWLFWLLFWSVGLIYTVWVGVMKWERLSPEAIWFVTALGCGEAIFLLLVIRGKTRPQTTEETHE